MKINVLKFVLLCLIITPIVHAGSWDDFNKFIKYSIQGKEASHEYLKCEKRCEHAYPIRRPVYGIIGSTLQLFFKPTKEQQETWKKNEKQHWQCKKQCFVQEKHVDQEIMTFDDSNGKNLTGSEIYKNCSKNCWEERNNLGRQVGRAILATGPFSIKHLPLNDQELRQCVAKCIKAEHPETEKTDQN